MGNCAYRAAFPCGHSGLLSAGRTMRSAVTVTTFPVDVLRSSCGIFTEISRSNRSEELAPTPENSKAPLRALLVFSPGVVEDENPDRITQRRWGKAVHENGPPRRRTSQPRASRPSRGRQRSPDTIAGRQSQSTHMSMTANFMQQGVADIGRFLKSRKQSHVI